jgi:hypothetical protein
VNLGLSDIVTLVVAAGLSVVGIATAVYNRIRRGGRLLAVSGSCEFRQNGILFLDPRPFKAWTGSEFETADALDARFFEWSRVERFEWDGDTLVFHVASRKAGQPGGERSVDVPPELRGEVTSIVTTHVGW